MSSRTGDVILLAAATLLFVVEALLVGGTGLLEVAETPALTSAVCSASDACLATYAFVYRFATSSL